MFSLLDTLKGRSDNRVDSIVTDPHCELIPMGQKDIESSAAAI
jgi:hypothetical protein